uniref:DUF4139 domain-containing protein n=1 Tax=Ditylenchus dipsaci TaxID=166011 RepID=A0A915DZM1_9BILA
MCGASMGKIHLLSDHVSESSDEDVGFGAFELDSMPISRKEARVEKQVLSTNFSIPQKKTIPSDTSEHKVTIAVLDLSSLLRLDCVPSKDTNVFLELLCLCGQQLFFQGANKISSKWRATSHNYQQQVGVINKSAITVHEQKIVVKNTKDEAALITVHENVPKSSDEKIKVKLQLPEVKNGHLSAQPANVAIPKLPEIGSLIDNNNNLQWSVLLGAQEERNWS